MAVLGTSVLQNFFQEYLDTELTYSKEVAAGLGLLPTESTLRWQGTLYPCVVHSSTFKVAKILMRVSESQWKAMEIGPKSTTLTMTFVQPKTGKKELVQFNGNLQAIQHHGGPEGERTVLWGLTFSHRPSESFLETQGSYLALKKEAHQRREDRISLNAETREVLGLASLNTNVVVDHIERKCLLRELSYGGARVILTGVAPFLQGKPFTLAIPLLSRVPLDIPGKIVRAEAVEGHKGLAMIALGYDQDLVPMEYLKTLQKGLKLGLGARQSAGNRGSGTSTSSIDFRTLKINSSQ